MIGIKRIYEPADPADGCRVLVDRLWPRGIRKEALAMDDWLKEVAPSNEVRRTSGSRSFDQRCPSRLGPKALTRS